VKLKSTNKVKLVGILENIVTDVIFGRKN